MSGTAPAQGEAGLHGEKDSRFVCNLCGQGWLVVTSFCSERTTQLVRSYDVPLKDQEYKWFEISSHSPVNDK